MFRKIKNARMPAIYESFHTSNTILFSIGYDRSIFPHLCTFSYARVSTACFYPLYSTMFILIRAIENAYVFVFEEAEHLELAEDAF